MQLLRIVGFALYFLGSCLFIHLAQLLGTPLYFFSKDDFYAYMALTKQYLGAGHHNDPMVEPDPRPH